jgi:hypothetical protein
MPLTTISSRSPVPRPPVGGVASEVADWALCAWAEWLTMMIEQDTMIEPRIHERRFTFHSSLFWNPWLFFWHEERCPARHANSLCKNRAQQQC